MPKKNKQAKKRTTETTGNGNNAVNSYTAKDIYVLEGLEPVRRRPGMYIGSTGPDGLHHLIYETTDNSLDEAMAGFAKNISVTLLPDNQVRVVDDGRGIPVEIHPQTKKSALETVMTTLHAGAKFGGESYKIAGGLHGVGISVVNALSKWMRVEVCRDGKQYAQEYAQGKATTKVKEIGKCDGSGTAVSFEPDPEIFKDRQFDWERILEHLRQQAYLTRGVKITVVDAREVHSARSKSREHVDTASPKGGTSNVASALEKSYTFYFEGGIISYVNYLNRNETPKHDDIFYTNKEIETDSGKILVESAFQYTDDIQGKELSFANNIYTSEGGMHLTGFRTALTRALNDYAKKNEYIKKDDDAFTGDDVREGITAIISVKIQNTALQFEGQTKAKLGNPEARSAVEAVVGEAVKDWLEKFGDDAREIIAKAILAQKARKAAKAARETVLRKGALEGFMLPGKLADCSSRKAEESELFIVEGDSAGGCFSGDTKVALVDGRNISFRQLVEEAEKGMKHYCYTMGEGGSIEIGEIGSPRITHKNAEVIKIVLDDNEEIICTPDHKFMLTDGTFKEAQYLTVKNSLMPFNRQHSKIGKRITIKGYELVFDPHQRRWIFTHLLADQFNLERGNYTVDCGPHRHHKDFNKLNNNPDNIIRLPDEDHLQLHRQFAYKTLRRPEVLEKLRQLRQTDEYRKKISHTMSSPRMKKILSQRAKKQWENHEYRNYMTRKFLEFYWSSQEYQRNNREFLNQAQKAYWGNAINRQKQAERVREYFRKNPERRREFSELAKQQWQDEGLKNWRREKTKEQWTSEFRDKRREAYNQTYLRKALEVMRGLYDEKGVVGEEIYNEIRRRTGDRSLIRFGTICERFFGGSRQKLEETVRNYNHKVKSIIPLRERMDVYDLEVPGTHNFALASGVFVHNSAKQARDRRFQAILPLRGKIMNVERARIDKMLSSEEIKALIIALGTAIADAFDLSNLRYHKIIIATDADVDGAHIRTLLLTLFFRHFLPVIEGGYLYIAQPPLYRIQKGKEIFYAYTDHDKERILKNLKVKLEEMKTPEAEGEETSEAKIRGVSIQRYKGLGEMNPGQLWETTMDPAKRILLQVNIKDAAEADKIFDILMGNVVEPRKLFIQTHAKSVKNLDI